MPLDKHPHNRYLGRHLAPRRHVAATLFLSGLMISSTATVGIPQAAHAFQTPSAAKQATSAFAASYTATSGGSERSERVSRSTTSSREALAPSARVYQGLKLKPKPPPWVLPVTGYHLTARFGQTGLWSHAHTGLDFAAPEGTQIRSIAPGTVVSSAYDGSYGNKTVIRLDDGTVLWYCHQSAVEVSPGQRVQAGELIGYVGSTGHVTGPHLHLEVHLNGGPPSDPEPWLTAHHLDY